MYLSILSRKTAILPPTEQIVTETYRGEGDHIKCYIVEVKKTTKGPQIMISAHSQVY